MTTCTEFAVFTVAEADLAKVISLSESLFSEINATEQLIISHQILQKTDNAEEICWHLTWANEAAVKASASQWSSYPSAAQLQALVGNKLYYGHFVAIIAEQTS